MNGYVLSPAAQADLGQIWDYSARTRSEEQADRCILGIRDACVALAEGRKKGRPADAIRPGYWKLAVISHLLFCRITETGLIDVVRILHQRMGVAAHLPGTRE